MHLLGRGPGGYTASLHAEATRRFRWVSSNHVVFRHNAQWYFNHVVWTDLCSSIIPLNEKKANEMALARKGSKGWMSPGSELSNINLARVIHQS